MNKEDMSMGNQKNYLLGFLLALLLSLAAWLLVHKHVASHHLFWTDKGLVITIISLALVQLFVQLTFFLHLFSEKKPRWNLTVLSFALIVVLILVGGSLWIIYNL